MRPYKFIKIKVKVKFTLKQATKAQMGVEIELYSFFNIGPRCGGWSTPRPGPFIPGKETRFPLRVGPRAGLDGCGTSRPHRDSIPGPSSP